MAQRLSIEAVHNSISNDIQMSHNIQPTCHDPVNIYIQYNRIDRYMYIV